MGGGEIAGLAGVGTLLATAIGYLAKSIVAATRGLGGPALEVVRWAERMEVHTTDQTREVREVVRRLEILERVVAAQHTAPLDAAAPPRLAVVTSMRGG